jgi:hypothetical protein
MKRIPEKIEALQKAHAAYVDVRAGFDRETDPARARELGECALRAWKALSDASRELTRVAHEVALGPDWERPRTGGAEIAARYNDLCATLDKVEPDSAPDTVASVEPVTGAPVAPLRGPSMAALPQPDVRPPPTPPAPTPVELAAAMRTAEWEKFHSSTTVDADGKPLVGAPMAALPQPDVRPPPSAPSAPNPHDPRHHRALLQAWDAMHGRGGAR